MPSAWSPPPATSAERPPPPATNAERPPPPATSAERPTTPLRPWQRLEIRLAALFAAVTVLAVAVVGTWIYDRQRREVEGTVGIQLLNIGRVGALLVDPALVMAARRTPDGGAPERLRRVLAAMQQEVLLTTPVLLLTDYDPGKR